MERRLSPESKVMLATLVQRSKRVTGVPFDPNFIGRANMADPNPPPLARLLRGGRGGEVRLKVYLCMLLIGVREPYDVTRTPNYWAKLLSLDDPEGNGARRVGDAIKWLSENKLIRAERSTVGAPKVYLRSQLGDGRKYVRPGPPRYVRIPSSFWENGWIVMLSPPAIAMMLILKNIQGNKPDPVFIVPAVADGRYALSQETRTKGFRELEANGLLRIGSEKRGDEAYWNRVRNTYVLNLDRLEESPGSPVSRV